MHAKVFGLCFALAMAIGCDANAEQSGVRLVKTVPLAGVEGRIDHMTLDSDGKRLFIAALGNNSVEVVDTETGARAGSIRDIKEPQGVCYIAESKSLLVSS